MTDTLQPPALADLAFYKAVLDALEAHVALIDSQGTILAVNASWQSFGEANGLRDTRFGVGANYFTVCRAAVDPVAMAAERGIKDILVGQQSSFYLEYPCHSPDEERWFALRATPLADYPNFAVLAHENITERVIAEKTFSRQEQNERLNLVVRRFPEWRERIGKLSAEQQQFRDLCKDYLELATWIGDYQSAYAGDRELLDAQRLLGLLAEDIEYYLLTGCAE
jgi:hypothetical protein